MVRVVAKQTLGKQQHYKVNFEKKNVFLMANQNMRSPLRKDLIFNYTDTTNDDTASTIATTTNIFRLPLVKSNLNPGFGFLLPD